MSMYMFFDSKKLPIAVYDRDCVEKAKIAFLKRRNKTWEECICEGVTVVLEEKISHEQWCEIYELMHKKQPNLLKIDLNPKCLPNLLVQELAAIKNARNHYLGNFNG